MANIASFGFLASSSPNIAAFGFLAPGVIPPVVTVASVPGPADGVDRLANVRAAREKREYWDDYVLRLLLLDQ